MSPPGWRKISSRPASDYRVLSVRELTVEDPRDGRQHPRVVIDSPDWVNVLALTEQGQVLLVRQFRFGVWADTLEIPGGMAEPGEAVELAAARELEEETGYRAASIELLGVCHPNPAIQSNRTFSFVATGCKKVHDGRPDEGELIEVLLAERDELPHLVRAGRITHALVLTALLFDQLRR